MAGKLRGNEASPPKYFMLREILAQPEALIQTIGLQVRDDLIFPGTLRKVEDALQNLNRIIIAASGSSRHAGLAGEIMIEDLSGTAVDVEYASEYCYRSRHAGSESLVLLISQSGETADTLAAQKVARVRGAKTIAICNAAESTLLHEACAGLLTHAAPEIAIPATKSFTSQLAVLYLFALFLARKRGRIDMAALRAHLKLLLEIPEAMKAALPTWGAQAAAYASEFRHAQSFLYLGRGIHYAIAREGALKLKEISYAHAEGFPTGELKHGPQALIAEGVPVVALVTCDPEDPDSLLRYRESLGVLRDVGKQGGKLLLVATEGDREVSAIADDVFFVPRTSELLLSILEVVPLQLFAYHVAVLNGCDVDYPRNLAKKTT